MVTVAKTAGFCFGVQRAVDMAEKACQEYGCIWALGDIIHNAHEVGRLEKLGVHKAEDVADIPDGVPVLIRAHGVPERVVQQLEQKGCRIVDATCPFVGKIHRIVREESEQGRRIIVIGSRNHPEVVGIQGWCGTSEVYETPEELRAALEKIGKNGENLQKIPVSVVAQTTINREIFDICGKIIKKQCTNAKLFDTICNATQRRQSEAAELAARVDVMVVVGDRKSANTRHLAEICSTRCARVYQIEGPEELRVGSLNGCSVAGLTAGASTPAGIIKEVYARMSDEIKNMEATEESFEEMLEKSFKTLNTGEKVTGIVTAIGPTEVQVDLGCKQAGYISVDELSADPNVKPEDVVKVGDEIETYIIRVNDVEGYAMLSKKRLDAVKVWEDIEKAREDKTTLEGKVTEENKGGLVANVKGVRVFIPASQSGVAKGGDMAAMVGKPVQLKITEVNRARRRVIGSIRAVNSEARKAAQEKIWSEIEVGKKYHGTVKSLTSYGAFVDIGGVDGMVHVSELSWNRIKTPADVVKVGDEIDVYVISFDPEKHKISLGYKTDEMNPWNQFMSKYSVGDVVEAKIVKLMTFGAFAEVVPGVDGLIHISQIADRRIDKPSDVLSEGQMVDAKITAIDEEKKKISLSIRALLSGEEEAPVEE